MLTYGVYKLIHFIGILMVFLAYGGLIVRAIYAPTDSQLRRLGAITSGIGMVLILLGGFGLQARLGIGWPGWFVTKFILWIVLGGLIVLINRKPEMSQYLWWGTLVLGSLAAMLAVVKPF